MALDDCGCGVYGSILMGYGRVGLAVSRDRQTVGCLACASILLALGAGCGAKTGLKVPDGGLENVSDAGVDTAVPPPVIRCVDVPFDGGPVDVSIETEAELGRADVTFLIDTTASMQDEIDRIRRQLRDRLAPAISEAIPDSQLAVATFADFPIQPYGDRDEDQPFILMMPSSPDLTRAQAAVNAIELGNGQDEPESQVEALYQLATGEGFPGFVPPSAGCPSGGLGYACFRTDALPVVMLFTDAPFHNGPGGRHRYGSALSDPPPHRYDEAVEALGAIGARVIGFSSGGSEGARDLRVLAQDTQALDGEGDPLVFDIGRTGERLGTGVVDAIRTFADNVIFDVDAIVLDHDRTDDVDPTEFIDAIIPLRGSPPDRIGSVDREAGAFRGVRAGARVTFQLQIRNDAVVPGEDPQVFLVEVVFRGDERTVLGREVVAIVIPGADGAGCDELRERDGGLGSP